MSQSQLLAKPPCCECGGPGVHQHPEDLEVKDFRKRRWLCHRCSLELEPWRKPELTPGLHPDADLFRPLVEDDGEVYGECLYCTAKMRYYLFGVLVIGWLIRIKVPDYDPVTGKRLPEDKTIWVPRTVKGLGCPSCMQHYLAEVAKGRKFWKIG